MLLYGRVERKADVYRVSLKLLDVKAKTIEIAADEMPVGGVVTGLARRLYAKLVGEAPDGGGNLVVSARSGSGAPIEGGRVMVDEDKKGTLAGGKLTLTGLPEGRHVVAIEAGALQRFEATVTIRAGEVSTLDALLVEKDKPIPESSRSHATLWKVSLGASLAIAAAGGALAAYADYEQQRAKDRIKLTPETAPLDLDESRCGDTDKELNGLMVNDIKFDPKAFRDACTWHTRNIAGFIVLGVGGAAAIASLIMLWRDPGSEERPPTVARNKKAGVAIAPILTSDVAGASMTLTW
jgi:hypothetical protein